MPHLLQLLLIVKREYNRASEYEKELHQLKLLIEMLDEFLKKANSMETNDDSTKASMKRAREFIYKSQDAIDDLMQGESNPQWGCVRIFSRRTFVSQATDITRTLCQYNETKANIEHFLPQLQAEHPMPSSDSSSSIAYSQEKDDMLEGIDAAKLQLVRWLTGGSMPKVIFVHGAQGIGKTSLVGSLLRVPEVKDRFKYYVWIKDLRSYNLVEENPDVLMNAKVVMWSSSNDNQKREVPLEVAFQSVRDDNNLKENQKKLALVLDDLRNPDVIDKLQHHLDPSQMGVLITTRDSSLELRAKKLAPASRTSADTLGQQSSHAPLENHGYVSTNSLNGFHNFKHVPLPKEHSLYLLRREMFSKYAVPADLKWSSESILETCEGLPLAILATCDLLKDKEHHCNRTPRIATWENMCGRLGEELISSGSPTTLIRRMITLRIDHLVRACLFYLSIFPLGCPIRCSPLMRLWMAEKFAMQENSADNNLGKLFDHNFIQEAEKTSYGRFRTCGVPKLQHEIIIKKSKDDEFSMIFPNQGETWPETIWRLSFQSRQRKSESADGTRDEQFCSLLKMVKRLRSLLVFEEVYPESLDKLLENVHRLKVLHLQASMNSFPTGIHRLIYLRYLKLSGTDVSTIPENIRDLAHLETLDLKGTKVVDLPHGILKLKKLHHLLVYRSDRSPDAIDPKHGVKAPWALGKLKSLQKLCMIELNPVKPSKKWVKPLKRGSKEAEPWTRRKLLTELGALTSLLRLGISKLRSEDVGLLCSSIKNLTNLEALHLIAEREETIDLEGEASKKAPRYLQRLHLTGYFRNLSKWLSSPNSLVKLFLKRGQYDLNTHQHLGELQGLKHLELQEVSDVTKMEFNKGWFPELRFLGLSHINSLDSIIVDQGALPTLEILSLARCQSLKTVPQDITRPEKLTCLKLLGMPDELKIEVKANAAVCDKMTVTFESWNDGALEVVELFPGCTVESPLDLPILRK